MKKRIVFFIVAIVLSINFMLISPVIHPIYNEPVEVVKCNAEALGWIKDFFRNLFGKNKVESSEQPIDVYLGGNPLGFTLTCEGVVVVAISNVMTPEGDRKPTQNSDIKEGDILYSLNGRIIESAADIEQIINNKETQGKTLEAEVLRGKNKHKTQIKPELDTLSEKYKLGLWIRDNAAGVGTLTYIRKDNKRFGALGHPVCDIDTGSKMHIKTGNIFNCNIVGISKGKRGTPGELRGMFLKSGKSLGVLDKNSDVGVYGKFEANAAKYTNNRQAKTATKNQVKTGKAKILCTLSGTVPDFYDIDIVKINYADNKKNMVIRITDDRLLEKSGGIVQGMSGSPIVQNEALVGAMTHVFVNDPTKGFAVYIDYMVNN